ncbi:hypothetical protein [Robbsia andropogonis]|uniref:hypothetical protein n=1 Tax=Robbsia andropogonis TaxID=28092 RepID=UPI0020A0999C|nr:hypothetical protein [Robbsia andropogonis]MCP1121555.1 hypothetical protein [Robbsia andropogonis]MCP1131359.1 hypothetical protein [Robbsia andropogonis]
MKKETITVSNPFELAYDQKESELTLTCVDTSLGKSVAIRFEPEATRALWDLLSFAASKNGGAIGKDEGKPVSRH